MLVVVHVSLGAGFLMVEGGVFRLCGGLVLVAGLAGRYRWKSILVGVSGFGFEQHKDGYLFFWDRDFC